jgi:hypothetical protein
MQATKFGWSNKMLKKIPPITLLLIVLIAATANAAVVFEDDFDNANYNGWNCHDGWPTWSGVSTGDCGYVGGACANPPAGSDGYGMYASSPGRGGSGNALAFPRCGDIGGYVSDLWRNSIGNFSDLYVSFSLKLEPGFEKSAGCSAGFKLMDRIWTNTSYSIYISASGGAGDCPGDIDMVIGSSAHFGVGVSSEEWQDGDWHHLEFRFNLAADTLTTWFDGVQQSHITNQDFLASYITGISYGLGNTTNETDFQATWKHLWIDDLVLSTTYVGPPEGGGDTTAPIIDTFVIPATASSLTVDITSFTAHDETGLHATPYCVTTVNNSAGCSWQASAPATVTFSSAGVNTAYGWARDANSNISTAASDSVTITLPSDTDDPVLSNVLPSTSQVCTANPRTVTLSATCSDNVACTACKADSSDIDIDSMGISLTQSGSTWSGTTGNLACDSSYTYYLKCEDASNNESDASTASFSIAAESSPGTPLWTETFDNNSFLARDWYDGVEVWTPPIVASPARSGNALSFVFDAADTKPNGWGAGSMRKLFPATERVHIRFWVYYSGWEGGYNPAGRAHFMHTLTDEDSDYNSLAYSNLTTYYDPYFVSGVGLSTWYIIQDGDRIDETEINTNMCPGQPGHSESRAVAGCNGTCGDAGSITDCYDAGGEHWNGRYWTSSAKHYENNTWHQVDIYQEMNSIVDGIGQADGKFRVWIDSSIKHTSDTVVFRTGAMPNQKFNQFIIAPYMGSGASDAMSAYIDDLTIYSSYYSDEPTCQASGSFSIH